MNIFTFHKRKAALIFSLFLTLAYQPLFACHGSGLVSASSTFNSASDETIIEVEVCLGVTDLFGLTTGFDIGFEGVSIAPTLNPSSATLSASYNFDVDASLVNFYCDCGNPIIGFPPNIESNTDTWTSSINGGTISYSVSRSNPNLTEECQIDCVDGSPTGISGGDANYTTDISACYVINAIFPGNLEGAITGVTMSGAESGECDGEESMFIDFSGGGALAVSLNEFDAETIEDIVAVNWTTEAENDVYKYVVERSDNDLSEFKKIGTVVVSGNSLTENKYTFRDVMPVAKGYYRLKTVDIDGNISYSKIILTEREVAATRLVNIFPNPIYNSTEIVYETDAANPIHFKIFDVNGALKAEKILESINGFNSMPIDFTELQEGIYFVILDTGEEKLIKRVTKIK